MSARNRAEIEHMAATVTFDPDAVPAGAFTGRTVGLWAAIVEQVVPRDPAGSGLVGPSGPGRPTFAHRGMFDLVVPAELG